MIQFITENTVLILGVMGVLAFIINAVVEMTKDLPVIKKLPTKAYVLIVAIVCCIAAVIIYTAVNHITLLWYHIILAFFAAFIIGYLAMYGWDTLKELWDRFNVGSKKE